MVLQLKLQYFGHLMGRADSLEKTLILGKIEGKEKEVAEDEMVRERQPLNGYEFGQAPGESAGQGSLACCSPGCRQESDPTK